MDEGKQRIKLYRVTNTLQKEAKTALEEDFPNKEGYLLGKLITKSPTVI